MTASLPTILVATRNRHKVEEIQAILGGAVRCESLAALVGAPEIVEDGATFAENARKKSQGMAAWLIASGQGARFAAVLADDSGLEVDALGGAPGVISARFAAVDGGGAGNASDADNNAKLLRLLAEVPMEKRTARFRCVLALTPLGPGVGESVFFDGACEGHIEYQARGQGGFGYDPLFVPNGFGQSFAELGESIKNRISHRSAALRGLAEAMAGKSG